MLLIGYLDSPYVRRTAITASYLEVPIERRDLSVFRDFDEFRALQPMVKVPTLITDDGQRLTDSHLIIRYLEWQSSVPEALTVDGPDAVRDLECSGAALVAMEKGAQLVYETTQRPPSSQHADWIERLRMQLQAALSEVERCAATAEPWICGARIAQSDIDSVVAWGFVNNSVADHFIGASYPALDALAGRAEQLAEFSKYSFR